MNAHFSWIECPAWELDFFALPHRIPWPADVPTEEASKQPFEAAHLLLGIELMEQHEPEAAGPWKSFAQAAECIQELNEALQDSEYVQAHELLDRIDSVHPGSPFAMFHRAFLERQNGRDAEALALYQQAAEKAPNLGFIWSHLGGMLGEAGRREEAVEAFHRALQVNNTDQLALEGLVQLRAAVKLFKDPKDQKSVVYLPVEQYREISAQQIQALADNPDQLVGFAEFQLREGHAPDVAVQALEKALEARPDHARTLGALGAAYRITGRLEDSVSTLRRMSEVEPANPWAFFNLAQTQNAAGNTEAEHAALDQVLALDPNFQPAIGIRFGLNPASPAPDAEEKVAAFAGEKNSWMAWLIACSLARDRGDKALALQRAEQAHALNPAAEETLLNLCSLLGESGDAARLEEVVGPALRSGKFSKRLDWNYAQALRQLGRTNEAVALLRDAASAAEAPEDFKQAAAVTVDFWNGFLAESGIPLEIHRAGALRRPVLLSLADGDGGVILAGGRPLPAEHRFPFRTAAAGDTELRVTLQQGQSGSQPAPLALGTFTISGIRADASGPAAIECFAGATQEGTLRFGALQQGRKLQCAWSAPE